MTKRLNVQMFKHLSVEGVFKAMNKNQDTLKQKKIKLLEELQHSTDIFKAMADPVRQDILLMFMLKKKLNVSQIVEQSPMSRPTISHHLKILKQAGIVDSKKEATEVYYWLTTSNSVVKKFKRIIAALEDIENDPNKQKEV